ncbi:hypothetical protein C7476_108173 [Phyllobacterium bourgognense]|uniref:Uncharacterized protein n=1 Tax=Phyllobacterium bourgognense TaxID=314236 RepID=A0A368YRZ5_9HYPH|nr:hypothetical protein C7476_108173 [Phyllobacterium bourgognense]
MPALCQISYEESIGKIELVNLRMIAKWQRSADIVEKLGIADAWDA